MDKRKYMLIITIVLLSFSISLLLNIYLALNKEIHLKNIHNQQHYVNESQATLILSVFAAQGKLRWDLYTEDYLIEKGFQKENVKPANAVAIFLNSLKPEQSLLAKVLIERNGYYLIYVPTIIEDMQKYNESKVWKKIK